MGQPYEYSYKPIVEPDWRRLPGYSKVTEEEWRSFLWQRTNSVRKPEDLKEIFGHLINDDFLNKVKEDQEKYATMRLLVPPQMINTMNEKNLLEDPVRR